MPDGTEIQLEHWNWSEIASSYDVATFPVAREDLPGLFDPKRGERFRCAFSFNDLDTARKCYDALLNGARLSEFSDSLWYPRYMKIID